MRFSSASPKKSSGSPLALVPRGNRHLTPPAQHTPGAQSSRRNSSAATLPGDRVRGQRPVRTPPGPGCPLHLSALPALTLRPNYRTFADHSARANVHDAEDAGAASHEAASLEETAAVSRQQVAGEQRVLRVRKVLP